MPPFAKPKTLRQAKADYQHYNQHVTPAEQRRAERAIELDKRAEAVRQRDARRRLAVKKREQQEEKERVAMRSRGIGLATQLAGNSGTQMKMKMGMEAFVGYWKKIKVDGEHSPSPPTETQDSKMDAEAGPDSDKELEDLDDLNGLLSQTSSVYTNDQNHMSDRRQTETESQRIPITVPTLEDDWASVLASSSQLARELDAPTVRLNLTRNSLLEEQTPKERASIQDIHHTDDEQAKATQNKQPTTHDSDQNGLESLRFASATAASPASATQKGHKSSYEEFGLSTQALYEAFAEDDFAFEQPKREEQPAMRTQLKVSLEPRSPPSAGVRRKLSLHDFGLSTQILSEAFGEAVELVEQDSKSSSSLGSGVSDQSFWEEAAFPKTAEVGA